MSRTPGTDHAKQQLLSFIRRVGNLREERSVITKDIAAVKKEAKDAGFDAKRIEDVVRWKEDCEKHGRDVVNEAEALFDLYRGVVDGEGQNIGDLMDDARDRALLKIFAPDDQSMPKGPTRKVKAVNDALAAAHANAAMRGPE